MAEPDNDEPDPCELKDLLMRAMRGVNGQAFRLFGNRIHQGPFVGMIIPERVPNWDDGNFSVKMLGYYEHELHDAVYHAIWREPDVIVNVGCAEGYYAIGFARALRSAQVFAFDINESALELCQAYARTNETFEQTRFVQGVRSPSELCLTGVKGKRLYLIDCEGAELDLVDLDKCPELVHSDIIVECHDFMLPSASRILADRLAATHTVNLIRPRVPDFERFQFVRQTPAIMSLLMIVEKRPMPCYWLTCWAHSRGEHDG